MNKLKNILKRNLKKWSVIFKTIKNKRDKTSDINRWKKKQSLFSSWDERTRLLANEIIPNSTVYEFGAARLVLKDMLPDDCTYLHSDIVSRAEDTLVADLNMEIPDIPEVDVIIFSGVLEYIFEIQHLLITLNPKTKCFIFSYATLDNFQSIAKRRENGWVSDHSINNLESIALKLNKKLVHFDTWKSQHLF